MKLKQIQAYQTDDVPDHVLEEIVELSRKLTAAILPLMDNEHPNKSLSAVNFVLAAVTKLLVSDDINEQRRAAFLQAKGIIGNVAKLNGLSFDEFVIEKN
jgi:hypothetical protein